MFLQKYTDIGKAPKLVIGFEIFVICQILQYLFYCSLYK